MYCKGIGMNEKDVKKILLVEDDMITALAESVMLRDNGYDVLTAADGETAVDIALKDLSIDLVLMDIDLGRGIDGPTAADMIIKKRDLPIVFLTSHSERAIVDKVRKITRYGFVTKNSGDFVILSSLEMAFELFEAHKKTKDSETNFRHLAENINEATWLSDAEMVNIIYMSPACWDIWKFDRSRRYENQWIFLKNIHPDDQPDVMNAIKLLHEHGTVYSGEFRIICEDGELRWIRGRAYPVHSQSGEIIRFAGVAEDITSRKSAEEALLKSEAKFRSYVENAPMAVIIVDNNGRFIEINPLGAKGLGYTEDEILKLSIRDIVDPSNVDAAVKHFSDVLIKGRAVDDILFRKKDGSGFWVQVNAVRLSEERLMAFCQDVTSTKKPGVFH